MNPHDSTMIRTSGKQTGIRRAMTRDGEFRSYGEILTILENAND